MTSSASSSRSSLLDDIAFVMIMGGTCAFFGALVVHGFLSGEVGWSYLFVRPVPLEALVTAIFSIGGAATTILGAFLAGFVVEAQGQPELQK